MGVHELADGENIAMTDNQQQQDRGIERRPTDTNNDETSSNSERLLGGTSFDRRSFLKGTTTAIVGASVLSSPASASHYETIQANGQVVFVGAGETYENKLIDLTTGNDFIIIVDGGNSIVRNIGFSEIYRGDDFMISITAPSGDVLIENIYLGDGATKEGSDHPHGPGGCFYHINADCDVTFRHCNVQGYPNNGFYCSSSASGGTITWESCFGKNNGVATYRGADGNDTIKNCVAYNDDTAPYFPGRLEDAGRPVWAWNPGPITIENSHFHSGLGDNTYPYALVAGANGDPSVINYNSGAFSGNILEADGSTINIDSSVGNNPDLSVPAGVPTSAVEAAEGSSGGGVEIPPPAFDDFERSNPIADYGGSTGLFSEESSTVFEGVKALTNTSGSFGGINSTSGLERYPSRGDEVHVFFNNASGDNFVSFNLFTQSETDNPERYGIGLSGVDGDFKLWKQEGGRLTTIANDTPSQQISGWYRAEIRTDSSTVFADLYEDSSDTLLASMPANDTTYSSGGIGFRSAGNGEVWDYAIRAPIEDFERASPLAEYGGSTGNFSVETSTVYEGSQAITNASGSFAGINSTSGLTNYPSRGDEVHYFMNNASNDNFAAVNLFSQSATDNPEWYSAGLSGVDGDFKLWKNEGGSLSTLDSTPPSTQISGWYRIEMRTDGTTVFADLYDDANDTLLASVSASDSTFSSGGIGFRSTGNGEVFDYVVR